VPSATKQRLRRSADPLGHWLDGVFRAGFDDDPSLPGGFRRRIATWARAAGVASNAQRELLAFPPDRTVAAAGRRAAKLAGVEGSPIWGLLNEDERRLVRNPGGHPQLPGVTYPVSIGELATLTGATNDQLRHWHELGLIRARRTKGGHRQFFADAAMRTFVMRRQMPQSYVTVLRDVQRLEGGSLLAGIALILQDQANEFEPAERDLMIHTADDLQQVSIAFARRSDALSSPALLGRGRRMRAVGRDRS
jgi:DNA-binding transcriptional MerR regulator